MEGYLDAYDPEVSATPSGIFVNRVEVGQKSSVLHSPSFYFIFH